MQDCSVILQKRLSVVGAIFIIARFFKESPVHQYHGHIQNTHLLQKYLQKRGTEETVWQLFIQLEFHLHDFCGTVLHNLSLLVFCSVKCMAEGKALAEQEVNILFYFLFSPVLSPRLCLLQTFQISSDLFSPGLFFSLIITSEYFRCWFSCTSL